MKLLGYLCWLITNSGAEGDIIEIGVWKGKSSAFMNEICSKSASHHQYRPDGTDQPASGAGLSYLPGSQFNPRFYSERSIERVLEFAPKTVLLHIDGGHLKHVLVDFLLYSPLSSAADSSCSMTIATTDTLRKSAPRLICCVQVVSLTGSMLLVAFRVLKTATFAEKINSTQSVVCSACIFCRLFRRLLFSSSVAWIILDALQLYREIFMSEIASRNVHQHLLTLPTQTRVFTWWNTTLSANAKKSVKFAGRHWAGAKALVCKIKGNGIKNMFWRYSPRTFRPIFPAPAQHFGGLKALTGKPGGSGRINRLRVWRDPAFQLSSGAATGCRSDPVSAF